MKRIATYVFLDLETTGIPKEEHNKTRITELSLVAVHRKHIIEKSAVRVHHKLSLCVCPRRLVSPGATLATGLCNFLLEHEPTFSKNTCEALQAFLKLFEKPICLIAHNGLNYDYPLLKSHLEGLHFNLDEDILCADSLNAFHDILEVNLYRETLNNETPEEAVNKIDSLAHTLVTSVDEVDTVNCQGMQSINEMTPKKSTHKSNFRNGKQHVPYRKKHSDVKRKVFWGENHKPKEKYNLKEIYERLVNVPAVDCHRAEADCMMLMKCAMVLSEQFVDWVEANSCLFSEVKCMRVGVPLGE